jgi:hypothetical protein
MKRGTALWAVAGAIAVIVLLLLAAKPYQPPKARAQRITTVNSVRTVSFVLTNASTNTVSVPQNASGKSW